MNEQEKEILDTLFYEDKNYIFGFAKFFEKIKENKLNISKSKALFYYNNQEITQLFKRKKSNIKLKIVNSIYPFEKVYVDSMYLTNANYKSLNFLYQLVAIHYIYIFY